MNLLARTNVRFESERGATRVCRSPQLKSSGSSAFVHGSPDGRQNQHDSRGAQAIVAAPTMQWISLCWAKILEPMSVERVRMQMRVTYATHRSGPWSRLA